MKNSEATHRAIRDLCSEAPASVVFDMMSVDLVALARAMVGERKRWSAIGSYRLAPIESPLRGIVFGEIPDAR